MINDLFLWEVLHERIRCAVTKIDRHYDAYAGIPVYEIAELTHLKDTALVVIAVMEDYHGEIIKTLKEYKFRNVTVYPCYSTESKR